MEANQHHNFDNLNIKEEFLKGIYIYGFKDPSDIQVKGIQSINTGKDCILQSQSGTGKTGTYLLGVMNNTPNNKKSIIISPTRELAKQIYNVAIEIGKYSDLKIGLFVGGTNISNDFNNINECNIIIGTVGRLNHILDKKRNIYKQTHIFVCDEADDLFTDKMGVSEDLNNIISNIEKNTQKILISATLNNCIFSLSKEFLDNPIKILLKKEQIAVDLISQFYVDTEIEDYKLDVLLDLYNIISSTQAIIFCNTIRKVDWLNTELSKKNFTITAIHGKMTQDERNIIVNEFRQGKTRILLTTDLLARGIDIPQVNLVINYDLPINKETYIHRIGRCGRFGKKGISISMVKMEDSNEVRTLNRMRNYYKININELPEDIENYL
jgi:translation initiation factor 4A